MSLLRRTYLKLLKNHFVVVQAVQTGVLMGAGDIIAQTVVERRSVKEYEPVRTAKFTFLGVCFVGPTLCLWYKFLARRFGTTMSTTSTLKKVSCDQLIFAPCFLVAFITSINLLNSRNFEHIKKELSTSYTDIIITNWKVWPAVQVVNFYFVPLHYQVLLVQSVALLWNTYLSWKTQKK